MDLFENFPHVRPVVWIPISSNESLIVFKCLFPSDLRTRL